MKINDGGKGCISMILPDEEMPTTEDGEKAEIILSPLGIINRSKHGLAYLKLFKLLGGPC
jgi:hypothetical protein